MTGEQPNLPAAGWYDDPEQPGMRRYWDGTAWTERREPAASGASGGGHGVSEIDRKFKALRTAATVFHVLGWVTAILGTLGVIAAAIAAGSTEETARDIFGDESTGGGASAVAVLIIGGIGVFVYSLLFFAAAGMIRLMIALEDNTRRTAEAVERSVLGRS